MKKLGIYIHIPFCTKKCGYCDFYSLNWDQATEDAYIEGAIKEIKGYRQLSSEFTVDTIFFGGGTPTVIHPSKIENIIETVKSIFTVEKNCEITIEGNPKSLIENLTHYKKIGINRLSIGIQSLDDTILKNLGRSHNSNEALEAIERAMSFGFENISVDLMYNIPGQNQKHIKDTISRLMKKDIKHISFYSLKLEEGTPMYLLEKNKEITMPDEDLERAMYYAGRQIMEKHQLLQYEISNFALKGYESRHNLKYWKQEEYIGIGPSAHSFLKETRFSNPPQLSKYISASKDEYFQRDIEEVMGKEDLISEYIILHIRLREGIRFIDFKKKFSVDFKERYREEIDYLEKNYLVEVGPDSLRLSERGMDLTNYVSTLFL